MQSVATTAAEANDGARGLAIERLQGLHRAEADFVHATREVCFLRIGFACLANPDKLLAGVQRAEKAEYTQSCPWEPTKAYAELHARHLASEGFASCCRPAHRQERPMSSTSSQSQTLTLPTSPSWMLLLHCIVRLQKPSLAPRTALQSRSAFTLNAEPILQALCWGFALRVCRSCWENAIWQMDENPGL